MKSNDLYHIIVKIFGLFLLKNFIYLIVQDMPTIIYIVASFGTEDGQIPILLSTFLLLAINGYIAYVPLFRTQKVIDKLKLNEGISEEVTISMHRSTVLSIAIIFLGGYIVISTIPIFLQELSDFFAERKLTYDRINLDKTGLMKTGGQIAVGVIIIVYQRVIVNFIEHKRRK